MKITYKIYVMTKDEYKNKKTLFLLLIIMNIIVFIFSTDFWYPKFKIFEFIFFVSTFVAGILCFIVYKRIKI